jgi:Domain of unknown function (DUF6089)
VLNALPQKRYFNKDSTFAFITNKNSYQSMTNSFISLKLRVWAFTLLTFLSASNLFSQNSELGLLIGGTAFYGDIAVRPETTLPQARPIAGLFYRYHTSDRWAFRGQLAFGQLYADEKRYVVASVGNWRQTRGVSFTTFITELSVIPQFRFFSIGDVSFYGFAGLTGLYFKPNVNYNEPNPIIGDNNPDKNAVFSKLTWAIPGGAGAQWLINDQTALGFEVNGRKTGTDFIDGLNLTTQTKVKDYYFFANFTFSTFIGQIPRGGGGRNRKNMGCPTF